MLQSGNMAVLDNSIRKAIRDLGKGVHSVRWS